MILVYIRNGVVSGIEPGLGISGVGLDTGVGSGIGISGVRGCGVVDGIS